LVLPSVLPHPELMVAEMRRVTRPGGIAAAAFWDSPGGTPHQRMLWDIAAVLDDAARAARDRTMSRSVYAPGALSWIFAEAGFTEVDQRSLMMRMDFADFADYWEPFVSGEGALGDYVASVSNAICARLISPAGPTANGRLSPSHCPVVASYQNSDSYSPQRHGGHRGGSEIKPSSPGSTRRSDPGGQRCPGQPHGCPVPTRLQPESRLEMVMPVTVVMAGLDPAI
jgi:hypothetical protein